MSSRFPVAELKHKLKCLSLMTKRITKEIIFWSSRYLWPIWFEQVESEGCFTPGALKPSSLGVTDSKARCMNFIEILRDRDIAHDERKTIRKLLK